MATIVEQSRAIITHPFFHHCIELAKNGDMSGFERLFYEIQSHVWEINSLQASRVYGQWHRANHCDVKREIRHCAPPKNLDLRLPIVLPIKIEPVIHTINVSVKEDINNRTQLLFTFVENT